MNQLEAARLAKSIVRLEQFTVEIKGEDDECWLVLTPTIADPEHPWLWHEIRKPVDWAKIAMSERSNAQ